MRYHPRTHCRRTQWPGGETWMTPHPHFLTIRWDVLAVDGTTITMQATLCKSHRQAIALQFPNARGVSRQFGEACDLCQGHEPRCSGGQA